MSYTKQIQKQKRKELKSQKKAARARAGSAYSKGGASRGKYLMGTVLLIAYITNSAQINSVLGGLI